jgi:predicted nucleic acid-binding protein
MGQQYLIDSNAVIDYLSGKIPDKGKLFMNKIINEVPNISVITKIEVLGYKTTKSANQLLNNFIYDSIVFGLSDEIVELTIEIRKKYKIKTPDAIVAATALQNSLILITNDARGFKNIEGLELVNPHDL